MSFCRFLFSHQTHFSYLLSSFFSLGLLRFNVQYSLVYVLSLTAPSMYAFLSNLGISAVVTEVGQALNDVSVKY